MANIGIILSGGILKGAYQAGALKAISEVIKKENIHCISAASIGALNAFAFATGAIDTAITRWQEIEYMKNTSLSNLIKSGYTDTIINHFCQNKPQLHVDMYVPLLNISKLTLEYVNINTAPDYLSADYLKAGICLPPFQSAVKIKGNNYIDGAIVDNVPFRPIHRQNIDYYICIYFDKYNYVFEDEYFNNRVIRFNHVDNTLVKNSISLKNSNISEMLKKGYEESIHFMELLFQKGTDDVEFILKYNSQLMHRSDRDTFRITGDTLVSNLNKVVSTIIPKYYVK